MSAKEILRELVKFETVKDRLNEEIIEYIENLLKTKKFKTEYKSKCLVMSVKVEQNLGFLGHTDTVSANDWSKDPLNMIEDNGLLYGLGICDMKGGIAAILQAVLNIDWDKMRNGIKLYFTYDEEINFGGIRELVDNNEKFPDNIIIGEPTNNELMIGSKGLLELKISFKGISAHASTPEKGINAIEKNVYFINELIEFYKELKEEQNSIFEIPYTTMNIGKIEGGESINIVPNKSEALIDFRTIHIKHSELILKKIDELAEKYGGAYEVINNIRPFITEESGGGTTNYITEASFIDSKNRYILGVGPVNPHEKDEYITIDSLNKLVEQYENMIYKFCN